MKTPVTRQDFVKIGKQHAHQTIIAAIDRLYPVGQQDIEKLATRGYSPDLLGQLEGWRDALLAESAAVLNQRGSKHGAWVSEEAAIQESIHVLRSGVVTASLALAKRPVPPGEAPDTTLQVVRDLESRIEAQKGKIRRDSALLSTRLAGLRQLLDLSDLAPMESEKPARQELLSKIDRLIAVLEQLSVAKETLQSNSLKGTSHMDEIKGRAFFNLKLLTQAGHALFVELGDLSRASVYQLHGRNKRRERAQDAGSSLSPDSSQTLKSPSPSAEGFSFVPSLAPVMAK